MFLVTRRIFTAYAISALICLSSCNSCKHAVKETINKTGKAVGSGAAEAGKGIYEGAAKEFESTVDVSENLKKLGVSVGKFEKAGADGHFHTLHLYLITEQDFNGTITIKLYDRNNKEYGRSRLALKRSKGDAGWADFDFDARTDFENNSRFVME